MLCCAVLWIWFDGEFMELGVDIWKKGGERGGMEEREGGISFFFLQRF